MAQVSVLAGNLHFRKSCDHIIGIKTDIHCLSHSICLLTFSLQTVTGNSQMYIPGLQPFAIIPGNPGLRLDVSDRMPARASTAGLRSAPVGAGRVPLARSTPPGVSRKKRGTTKCYPSLDCLYFPVFNSYGLINIVV